MTSSHLILKLDVIYDRHCRRSLTRLFTLMPQSCSKIMVPCWMEGHGPSSTELDLFCFLDGWANSALSDEAFLLRSIWSASACGEQLLKAAYQVDYGIMGFWPLLHTVQESIVLNLTQCRQRDDLLLVLKHIMKIFPSRFFMLCNL